jgi:hypothetical protein
MFLNCSTSFGRHAAAAMAEWELQFPLGHGSCWQSQMYVKPEAAITVFELLIMSGVSLETC